MFDFRFVSADPARPRGCAALLIVLLAGCELPNDPEGTLERVRGGTLRAGVVHNPPWTCWAEKGPSGVEIILIREFARQLGAETDWFSGTESELLEAVERRKLDVAVGGLTDATAWKSRVSLTYPYITTQITIAHAAGASVPSELEGVEVAYPRQRPRIAAYLDEHDAIPIPVDDLTGVHGLLAAERWELAALGLRPSDLSLHEDKHVIAVARGENAFLVRLERFLLEREPDIRQQLREAAP